MATAAEIEALRLLMVESAERRYSTGEVARIFRAPLFPAFDAAGFVEVASDLEAWATWRYERAPRQARSETARGIARLSNASPTTPATFGAGALLLEHPTSGAQFRNLDVVQLPAKSLDKRTRIEAEEGGEAGTAPAGLELALVPPVAGVSASVVLGMAGVDAATRAEYVATLLSPDLVSEAVRAARRPNMTRVGANRARDFGGQLSAARAAGALSGLDRDELRAALGVRPRAAALISAIPLVVPVAYELEVLDAQDGHPTAPSVDLAAAIGTRLQEFFAAIPIGPGIVGADALHTSIGAALGMLAGTVGTTLPLQRFVSGVAQSALVGLVVTSPAADVALAAHEVAVLGTVTPTIIRS